MEFFEERERMRKLLAKPGDTGRSGVMGNAGTSSDDFNPNLYVTSGTTENYISGTTENNVSTEKTGKKVKFNIQAIESERERLKTSWKFWKK